MANNTNSNLTLAPKPETVASFQEMFAKKQDFLEYLVKFGNSFERAAASVVIDIAKGV